MPPKTMSLSVTSTVLLKLSRHGDHHLPGQAVPIPHHSFWGFFPNTQLNLSWYKVITSCPSYLPEKTGWLPTSLKGVLWHPLQLLWLNCCHSFSFYHGDLCSILHLPCFVPFLFPSYSLSPFVVLLSRLSTHFPVIFWHFFFPLGSMWLFLHFVWLVLFSFHAVSWAFTN